MSSITSSSSSFSNLGAVAASLPTARARLLKLMSNRRWYTHVDIRNIVGTRYNRVMSELRAEGFVFKKTFSQSGRTRTYFYRIVSSGSSSNS